MNCKHYSLTQFVPKVTTSAQNFDTLYMIIWMCSSEVKGCKIYCSTLHCRCHFMLYRNIEIVFPNRGKRPIIRQSIYRVIQEESAILWEMIVCVILRKKVHMNMGPILNGYRDMVKRWYGPSCEHEQKLRNKLHHNYGVGVPHQSGYTCWPCSSHQQCLCPYKGPPSWATACNTQYPATRSQVHWGWWRHLWKFVMRCARRRRARVLSIADHQ